jgi:biopolymer transport protein ExbD
MSQKKMMFDVWLVQGNSVYRSVPYEVVTDWLQQGRLLDEDRIRPSGTEQWFVINQVPAFAGFIPQAEPLRTDETAEAMEPVETGFEWKHKGEEEETDPDMIPLIDVSLVLLIFFMLTSSAAAIGAHIKIPESTSALELTGTVEHIWIGVNFVGEDQPPRYSISFNKEGPQAGDNDMTEEQTIQRVEAVLQRHIVKEIRVAAHKQLSIDLLKKMAVELQRFKTEGKVEAVKFEVGVKK